MASALLPCIYGNYIDQSCYCYNRRHNQSLHITTCLNEYCFLFSIPFFDNHLSFFDMQMKYYFRRKQKKNRKNLSKNNKFNLFCNKKRQRREKTGRNIPVQSQPHLSGRDAKFCVSPTRYNYKHCNRKAAQKDGVSKLSIVSNSPPFGRRGAQRAGW